MSWGRSCSRDRIYWLFVCLFKLQTNLVSWGRSCNRYRIYCLFVCLFKLQTNLVSWGQSCSRYRIYWLFVSLNSKHTSCYEDEAVASTEPRDFLLPCLRPRRPRPWNKTTHWGSARKVTTRTRTGTANPPFRVEDVDQRELIPCAVAEPSCAVSTFGTPPLSVATSRAEVNYFTLGIFCTRKQSFLGSITVSSFAGCILLRKKEKTNWRVFNSDRVRVLTKVQWVEKG